MATTHSPWLPTNQQLRQAEGLWRQRTTRDKVVGRQSAWGSIKVFSTGQIALGPLLTPLSPSLTPPSSSICATTPTDNQLLLLLPLQCFLFSSFSLAAAESLGKDDDDDGQRKVTLMEMISLCSSLAAPTALYFGCTTWRHD